MVMWLCVFIALLDCHSIHEQSLWRDNLFSLWSFYKCFFKPDSTSVHLECLNLNIMHKSKVTWFFQKSTAQKTPSPPLKSLFHRVGLSFPNYTAKAFHFKWRVVINFALHTAKVKAGMQCYGEGKTGMVNIFSPSLTTGNWQVWIMTNLYLLLVWWILILVKIEEQCFLAIMWQKWGFFSPSEGILQNVSSVLSGRTWFSLNPWQSGCIVQSVVFFRCNRAANSSTH